MRARCSFGAIPGAGAGHTATGLAWRICCATHATLRASMPNLERRMTTMNNEDPADPSVHEPRVTDAPAEIWLVYGELEHDDTHANLYRDGDVTWCQHQIGASDVRYVRAEKMTAVTDAALPLDERASA